MAEAIRPLTTEAMRAQAREAAEHCIPLEEAHAHLAHDTELRAQFDRAYNVALLAEVA